MLRGDLVRKVQSATGMTLKDAEAAVKAVFDSIEEALASGERVLITGFGQFLVRNRKARTGVNPQNTKQKIQLPATKIPAFKPGQTLKNKVVGK